MSSRNALAPDLTPQEAREIARDAYVYGFPIVDNYRVAYAYFVDPANPEYKGGWNTIHNMARVFTPQDVAVQTPNSDTPYSMSGADLRAEPIVYTVPPIAGGRYFSLQFIDLYTHNFAYVGSRATGNGGGSYLLAGPGWSGETPPGIDAVIRSETELVLVAYRTQLFSPEDLDAVRAVQAGYKVQPLSAFLGQPAPPAAPAIDFPAPLGPKEERTDLRFFDELNFALRFCPTVPRERALMTRFARLGIGAGLTFDPAALSPDIRAAVEAGIADAWAVCDGVLARMDDGELSSSDFFGTRAEQRGNYAYRMAGAVFGIYGNSVAEAMYPSYRVDGDGNPLDASKHAYALRFAPGDLPPVNAFWSVTMYSLPDQLLVDNPLDRYLINAPMLDGLAKDADGGITLEIRRDAPGGARDANWLPAPDGPFFLVLRLYWPKPEALDGSWSPPPLRVAG